MARTINYRVKAGPGALQRAVIDENDLPQSITGLVNGTTYEVDVGNGVWVDVTPANNAVTLTGLSRQDTSSTSGTTGTKTGYDISAAVGPKLLVAFTGRANNTFTGGSFSINGGAPVTATLRTGGLNIGVAFAVVDKPAGSTMDISFTGTGGFSAYNDSTMFFVWDLSGGTITDAQGNGGTINTTDTTFTATLNVPAGGAVAAIFMPRFTDGLTPAPAVLSNVDVDASTSTAAGSQSRIFASRDSLSADAAYVVSTTVRRSSSAATGFGAVVIGA